MNVTKLGNYKDLYAACSRLDDARLLDIKTSTKQDMLGLELRFDISTNPGNPNRRLLLACDGLKELSFHGDDLNQFMLMSGYPDSLFIREEGGIHALYFLPNSSYPNDEGSIEVYEMKISCKNLRWAAS